MLLAAVIFYYRGVIKMVLNENITIKNGVLPFEIDMERMYVYTMVNGERLKLQVDTGATQHLFFDEKAIHAREATGISILADKSVIKSKAVEVSMENEILKGSPMIIKNISRPINKCSQSKGFFSLANFVDEDVPVVLDFKKNQIQPYTKDIDLQNYGQSDMKVELTGLIKLKLSVDGVSDWYIFDTGAITTVINEKQYPQAKREDYTIMLDKNKTKKMSKYLQIPIRLGSKEFRCDVGNSEGINRNILGILFIKHFNWILDFENNKVYFQRVEEDTRTFGYDFSYTCKEVNQQLVIAAAKNGINQYKLGQQILSVNGVNITPENICHYQKLLNQTQNWEPLGVVVK